MSEQVPDPGDLPEEIDGPRSDAGSGAANRPRARVRFTSQAPPRLEPAGRLGRWLAGVGGMRPTLVDSFPGDRQQYVALSFLLFATMTEAMVAGGFAVTQAFPATAGSPGAPLVGAVAFSVVWGLIIFAIDRYMVLGLDAVHGPRALILMVFRALLALVLGFVMATPLVIAVFSSDIATQVQIIRGEQLQDLQLQEVDAKAVYDDLKAKSDTALADLDAEQVKRNPTPDADPNVVRTRQTMEASQAACDTANLKAAQEYNGVLPVDQGGSGTVGPGPQYRALAAAAQGACDQARADVLTYQEAYRVAGGVPVNLDASIAAKQTAAAQAQTATDNAFATYQQVSASVQSAEAGASPGLLTSLAALSRLIDGSPAVSVTATTSAKPAVEGNRNAWWGHAGLVALLVGIELVPVLFKGTRQALHGWRGDEAYLTSYERACQTQDERAAGRIADWEESTSEAWRTEASLVVDSAVDMRTRQRALQEEMNAEIVLTQRALMRRAIRHWRREQAARWGGAPESPESGIR